jgi:hypothetical protein
VRAVEAWLLADRKGISRFLRISQAKVPDEQESLDDPERTLVDLARLSRRNAIRKDMVPREGSGRSVGPAYASRLVEFATGQWQPEAAAERCESLRRAMECLERLVKKADGAANK